MELERLTAIGQAVEGVSAAMGDIAGGLSGLSLFDEIPCFVAVHHRSLKVVTINRLYRERLGDRVGQASCSVYPPEDNPNVACPAALTVESGVAQRCKATIQYANGDRWPVVVHTAPIRNRNGELELILEIAADVSEIKRLQEALKTTQRRYRQLFDEVPCFISVLDRHHNIIATNRDYKETFGEGQGRRCYEVFKQRTRACDLCPVRDTFSDGVGRHVETTVTGSDGRRRDVLMHTTPLRRDDGAIHQVMEMATDITELRLLQDNLSSLGLMVGAVSHGIKGILTGLDAGLYLIETGRRKGLPDRLERGIDRVASMTERIRKVVLDLLYCAKDREPRYTVIDPSVLVADLRNVIDSKLAECGIELISEIDPCVDGFEADEAQLHTALFNILNNAVEACRNDRLKSCHRVRLHVTADGRDHVLFEIIDNGPGMDDGTRERLFDLFFSSKADKGTGLGLFLAHKAISQHSGQISVASQPDRGTRFTIRLPRRRPQPAGQKKT